MRIIVAAFTAATLCWMSNTGALAAPPEPNGIADRGANEGRAEGDAPRDKPAATQPSAAADKDPKKAAAATLAERRAAAASKKVADAAKRLFPRFDANRDQVLDDAEWAKAKAAIDKMIDAEVFKSSGNRRELVREALKNVQRPEVQRNGTDIAPEAAEQYARALLAAASDAADKAQPVVVPAPQPPVGRRAGSDGGDDPRRGRFNRPLPRGDATDAERAREEALRRRGLREDGGKVVPIVPGRQGGDPRANPQRPNPPRGARP